MKRILQIQSVGDLITNSSSEVFIVSKDDLLYYIDKYDLPGMDCFRIKKLNWQNLKAEEWMSYDVESSDDIEYEYVLELLRIPLKQAKEEGLELYWKPCGYTEDGGWLEPIDLQEKFWNTKELDDGQKARLEKEHKDTVMKFFKSWVKFCKKHHEEIKEKVIGKYIMEVEDHFEAWSEFREEIEERGWFYRESHH